MSIMESSSLSHQQIEAAESRLLSVKDINRTIKLRNRTMVAFSIVYFIAVIFLCFEWLWGLSFTDSLYVSRLLVTA